MATVAKSTRSTTITLAADSAGPFDLNFRLFDDDGIQVYVNNIARTDFTLSSNYVDGYDDNATITFNASLSSGDVIIIDSSLTPGRAVDYLDGPNLTYLQNIELGRLWAAIADIKRDVNRSVKFFGSVSPLALEAGRMVVVNSAGDGMALGAVASEIPAAEGHAQKAKKWAEEVEDTEVETGQYSALHWAAKAAASAAAAATFDPNDFYTKVQADARYPLISSNVLPPSWIPDQATAEAGTNNTQGMTPLRVRQLIDADIIAQGVISGGSVADVVVEIPTGFEVIEIETFGFAPETDGSALGFQVGTGTVGSPVWQTTYAQSITNNTGGTISGATSATTYLQLVGASNSAGGYGQKCAALLEGFNASGLFAYIAKGFSTNTTPARQLLEFGGAQETVSTRTLLRLIAVPGNIKDLTYKIRGIR